MGGDQPSSGFGFGVGFGFGLPSSNRPVRKGEEGSVMVSVLVSISVRPLRRDLSEKRREGSVTVSVLVSFSVRPLRIDLFEKME